MIVEILTTKGGYLSYVIEYGISRQIIEHHRVLFDPDMQSFVTRHDSEIFPFMIKIRVLLSLFLRVFLPTFSKLSLE